MLRSRCLCFTQTQSCECSRQGFVNAGRGKYSKRLQSIPPVLLFSYFFFVYHLKALSWGIHLVQLTSTSVLRDSMGISRTPSMNHSSMSSGNGPECSDLGFMSGQLDLILKQDILCIQRTTVSCLYEEKNVSWDCNGTYCFYYILLCLLNLFNSSWIQNHLSNWLVSSY